MTDDAPATWGGARAGAPSRFAHRLLSAPLSAPWIAALVLLSATGASQAFMPLAATGADQASCIAVFAARH